MKKTYYLTIPVTIDVEVEVTVDERPGTHLDPPECTIDYKFDSQQALQDLDNDIEEQVNQLDYDWTTIHYAHTDHYKCRTVA